ncbi:hypothetical protein KGM_210033 [Danaus plexippus plexippus]|uniref:Uncharacterized protein n=1 Tax=Danaus plexippus plexippus TaxID=278856 RepID=A0A212F1B7_DANPL|nr:hypothetical protein KGM_210033 [Danaus plexippus plexippus]
MTRKTNEKRSQKPQIAVKDVVTAPPQYETAFAMSNTEVEGNKNTKLHSCKCRKKDKKKDIFKHDRNWQSITNLYGDTDTTHIWDNELQKPKAIYKIKQRDQIDPYFDIENYKTNVYQENINPTYNNVKSKPAKISLLSLYRRHKKNKYKKDQYPNENFTTGPYVPNEPNIEFKFTKKPGKKFVIDRFATGDVCRGGPCRETLEHLQGLQDRNKLEISEKKNKNNKKAKSKERRKKVKKKREDESEIGEDNDKSKKKKEVNNKKNIKTKEKDKKKKDIKVEESELKTNSDNNDETKYSKLIAKVKTVKGNAKNSLIKMLKEDLNIGQGDQGASLRNNDLKAVKPKTSFIDKMFRITCKCKSDNGRAFQTVSNAKDQTGEPFFEMKVDSSDMQVMNSQEINDKLRKLGRSEKKLSCMCPSRLNRLQSHGEETCRKGICEKALKKKDTSFNCKCVEHKEILECKDSTCNLKIKGKNKINHKREVPVTTAATANKPLFQVMLDSKHMNIINSKEILDIIRKPSANEVCSAGICKTAKDDNVDVNCRCIGKKLRASVFECDKSSCKDKKKKCALSYYCSRVFSKSETWSKRARRRQRRLVKRSRNYSNIIEDKKHIRSDQKTVTFDIPHGLGKRHWKQTHDTENEIKVPYLGEEQSNICKCYCECYGKKKKKKIRKRRRRKKGFFKRQKRDDRTCSEKMTDCVEKQQELCEKKLKKKKKLYDKQERKALKENKRIEAEQKAVSKKNAFRWNYITNMISGVLNITIGTAITVIKIPFWLLGDPVGSYVYVREKSKDPASSIERIFYWFVRTWNNKTTCIARKLQESSTMNVLADQIEDSDIYNAIFSRGRSAEEKALYERRSRIRKRRMLKRQEEALYSCRHMLLTTMRKTPCLWFYHVCPDLYPQCLSFVSFMNNFIHIVIYLLAILMWTPCIITFEMCRAFLCCFFCTH